MNCDLSCICCEYWLRWALSVSACLEFSIIATRMNTPLVSKYFSVFSMMFCTSIFSLSSMMSTSTLLSVLMSWISLLILLCYESMPARRKGEDALGNGFLAVIEVADLAGRAQEQLFQETPDHCMHVLVCLTYP